MVFSDFWRSRWQLWGRRSTLGPVGIVGVLGWGDVLSGSTEAPRKCWSSTLTVVAAVIRNQPLVSSWCRQVGPAWRPTVSQN